MDDFIIRSFLAAIGVAVVAGPLGCFVVWRRMVYFGAALAHSALLGVALGFLFEINLYVGVIFVGVAISVLLVAFDRQRQLATDTLLGILAHGALAMGLIALAFMETVRIDLVAYLFGDILAVTADDVAWIYAGGLASLGVLAAIWRWLLAVTVDSDLAEVEGVPVNLVRLVFMLLTTVVIAVAMKIVGMLLIVSLLIIPAAAARRFAATPEQMAILAALVGCLAAAGGLASSFQWDTPAGPSIVAAATGLFFVTLIVPFGRAGRRKAQSNSASPTSTP